MSTAVQPDLRDEAENKLVTFAREARVGAKYRNGGPLNNAMTLANMELLDTLQLDQGMVIDPANVAAFVLDSDCADEHLVSSHKELTEPAVSVTERESEDGYDVAVFEFAEGHRTGVKMQYIELIEEIYGVNVMHFPQRVKSHPDTSTHPIKVADSPSDTWIIVAPLTLDYREDTLPMTGGSI